MKYGPELSWLFGKQIEDIRATKRRRRQRQEAVTQGSQVGTHREGKASDGKTRAAVLPIMLSWGAEHLAGQRRIRVPLRDITRRAGRALLELKPCWIMSPLAVAQFIPKGSIHFDICAIDEASQMPPEDAARRVV